MKILIPVPGGDTIALHIGNAFCVLTALVLGGYGSMAGTLGMTIADVSFYFVDKQYYTSYNIKKKIILGGV